MDMGHKETAVNSVDLAKTQDLGVSNDTNEAPPGPSATVIEAASMPVQTGTTDMKLEINPPAIAAAAQPQIVFSPEQRAVLDMVKSGRSVFFTGSAGTGKSVLLREIIRHFRARRKASLPPEQRDEPDLSLAVTASTGIASVNIQGCTLHSWAGVGLGKEDALVLARKMLGKDSYIRMKEDRLKTPREERKITTSSQWRGVKTLIIDEISMIDGMFFDKLEYIARYVRGDNQPFGGIQLVLSGDFFQLPPVPDHVDGVSQQPVFAFDAHSWPDCIGQPVILKKVFRQKDEAFVDMLHEMRYGRLSPRTIMKFKNLSRRVVYKDGIEPTELYPTRREVDSANHARLNQLSKPSYRYVATDKLSVDDEGVALPFYNVQGSLDRLIAPKDITLKIHAQVMLIKNLAQGALVNGSKGRVVNFLEEHEARGRDILTTRPPHTDDNPPATCSIIADGQTEADARLHHTSTKHWPLVWFENGQVMLCTPSTFEVSDARGKIEAVREQIPLILAWALSIHKSQGQTLQRVRVNLGRTFEKGQAYVALSRATSMETLEVQQFEAARVLAHPRVIEWMDSIPPVDIVESAPAADAITPKMEVDSDEEYWGAFED